MPQSISVGVLYDNFDISVPNVPSNYEEGDTLVNEVGGVLKGFIADCTARNFLPRLYATVSKKLVEQGHARGTKEETKEDKTVKTVFTETPIVHIGRIHDAGDETLRASIGEMLQSTADAIPFYVKGERTGFGGKISEAATNAANSLFAAGASQVDETIEVIEANVPGYKVGRDSDGAATPESLARGIQAFSKHAEREAKAIAMGKLVALKAS